VFEELLLCLRSGTFCRADRIVNGFICISRIRCFAKEWKLILYCTLIFDVRRFPLVLNHVYGHLDSIFAMSVLQLLIFPEIAIDSFLSPLCFIANRLHRYMLDKYEFITKRNSTEATLKWDLAFSISELDRILFCCKKNKIHSQPNFEIRVEKTCIISVTVLVDILFSLVKPYPLSPQLSSGQSSWLQIRRPGFDSRHYKKRYWVWNGVHSASWVQLRSYLIEK
jgi:hypothetical protein